MAERIVSPGVFTNEKDLSFLPEGISDIGAALIGPTEFGPAFVPTIIRNFGEFETLFGKESQDFYVPFTAKQYLRSAGTVTIVRVLGLGGYANDSIVLGLSGSFDGLSATGKLAAAVLKPSRGAADPDALELAGPKSASIQAGGTKSSFVLNLATVNGQAATARETFNLSFDSGSANYINGARTSLFKVTTRSHGTDVNSKYRIGINDVKRAADVPGSDYGSFGLQVIVNNPGQNDDGTILESFSNLNFDEESVNYLPRAIGDKNTTIDSNGKLTNNGDYPNQSKYVYISNFSNLTGISKELVPMGFEAVTQPHVVGLTAASGSGGSVSAQAVSAAYPTASFKGNVSGTGGQKNARGTFDRNVYYGFDFDNTDNQQYLKPTPTSAGAGNNVSMSLEDAFGNDDASVLGATFANSTTKISLTNSSFQQRKFAVPFQGGYDGQNPAIERKSGTNISATNTQGFDLSSATASGSVAFKRAINAVSNPEEFDINLLALPGVIHSLHPSVTNHAIDKVEDRADAFFILDGSPYNATIQQAINNVKTLDSNYVGTYYPWVKILDSVKGKPTWVPPSVVLPGVYANNDRIGQEWFAPAGLNRGGLSDVLETQTRLTNSERDDLYENRINPIATFPGQGVVVFGQKTLQGKPSALDRINVRRLLIRLRKFIASSSRFLVFEQNTNATRNRFLNIVNPFLEQVQANSGLTAFRVVMDESNNTPDVVDRNQLVGQIFIQPTRTAEFIVLDFVVQPTGATFPE
jgi:hypothetical protein